MGDACCQRASFGTQKIDFRLRSWFFDIDPLIGRGPLYWTHNVFADTAEERGHMTQQMTCYPLIFTYRDAVSGNGFLAGVTVTGRALITREDGKWWMYGVRPAGIAETGNTPNETFLSFRQRYSAVLFDIAAEAETFEAFKEEVERFFQSLKRWRRNYSKLPHLSPSAIGSGIHLHGCRS